MLPPDRQPYRVEEYLWEEQRSQVKREYLRGQVYAMAGGNFEHSLIAVNLTSELRTQLRKRMKSRFLCSVLHWQSSH